MAASPLGLGHERWSDAAAALERSRELGTDPTTLIHPSTVEAIEANAQPSILDWVLRVTIVFVIVYALIMLAMAVSGTVLAWFTRGRPRRLPDVVDGKILLSPGERILSHIYIAAPMGSSLKRPFTTTCSTYWPRARRFRTCTRRSDPFGRNR